MTDPLSIITLVVALLIMFVGLMGTILPVIPGTILIFVAAFLYALVEGFHVIGWPTLVVLGLLAIAATTADIWASGAGAKMGGASGWSVALGLLGGLIGLVLFSLPGAIVGALLVVLLIETFRQDDWRQALKAGSGWVIGWALSTVAQLGIGLSMVAIFVWQVVQGP
ncbi:MAG: DUF456 domain-containing protein [Anaerolineae bacterium]|jgi:uncharacterized protein YqgC (DUF456 family)